MGIRRNAWWQQVVDERVLEVLEDEPWSTPEIMVIELPIEVTKNQIIERCMVLADAGLVAIEPSDDWRVQLTTEGKLYLDGESDVDLYQTPRSPKSLEELMRWK